MLFRSVDEHQRLVDVAHRQEAHATVEGVETTGPQAAALVVDGQDGVRVAAAARLVGGAAGAALGRGCWERQRVRLG